MKQYLGVDVSSRKLNIHFNGNDFEIINSKEEIEKFIRDQKLRKKGIVIGAESTSRYHLLVQEIFVKKGFEFRLLNPILTGQKIQASIRKKKTDISDAKIIANLLMQGEGNIIKKDQLDTTRKALLRTRKITKRGNVHLRSAFYLAAQVARCHDPQLKEFYQKKKLEGKPTRVAIIAVARKLCERVFAVIKKGEPYEIRQPSFS